MTILGSLVIHATQPVAELPVPELSELATRAGRHVEGKYNGSYREYFDVPPMDILIPQRYKSMSLLAPENVRHSLAEHLSVLDSQYEGARQLYKLQRLMDKMPDQWHAVVNVSHSGADGLAQSGAFYVMSASDPMFVTLVFDSLTGSVQLVWSTFDIKARLRQLQAMNYSFFSMPTQRHSPLFVPSQNLCSKWWRLSNTFKDSRWSLIKTCNALEMMLYKNPNTPVL